MEVLQIVGIGLIATFLAITIKEIKPSFAFLITVFVGTAIFVFLIDRIYTIIEMIQKVAINANVNTVYLKTILKIIGIAYIIEFASGIAKDAGQGSIASRIELAGKILILSMAVPILTVLIDMIIKMIPL
ncbi:MAG: stage III sporulation protein AD [Caldibacillus sp.]